MSIERAEKAYEYYKDLNQRAEYLLIGLLAASIGFFWQNGKPERLGVNPATLHLLGILLLLASLLCAIVRVHRHPFIYAVNADMLDAESKKATLVGFLSRGDTAISPDHGPIGPLEQVAELRKVEAEIAVQLDAIEKANRTLSRLFRLRNTFLVLGYAAFLAHRIWLPYAK